MRFFPSGGAKSCSNILKEIQELGLSNSLGLTLQANNYSFVDLHSRRIYELQNACPLLARVFFFVFFLPPLSTFLNHSLTQNCAPSWLCVIDIKFPIKTDKHVYINNTTIQVNLHVIAKYFLDLMLKFDSIASLIRFKQIILSKQFIC